MSFARCARSRHDAQTIISRRLVRVKIGQVARLAGVGIDTIRFYERRGLLAAPRRSASGYRNYSSRTVSRLRLAKQLQQLGFSRDEVTGVLRDVDRGAATCAK
jgi:DNA-binding transcriptional MerR regulator